MSTNYTWTDRNSGKQRSIGLSSGGWCFALRVYPDAGINTLVDWTKLFNTPGSVITDEIDRVITVQDMMEIITDRCWRGNKPSARELAANYGMPGPNGLARSVIGKGTRCVGHGEGTWDYFAADACDEEEEQA
jgi:hypothetical protein